jgi:hypothetical protein
MCLPAFAGARGAAVKDISTIAVRPTMETMALSELLLTAFDGFVNCTADAAGTVTSMLPASQSSVVTTLRQVQQ